MRPFTPPRLGSQETTTLLENDGLLRINHELWVFFQYLDKKCKGIIGSKFSGEAAIFFRQLLKDYKSGQLTVTSLDPDDVAGLKEKLEKAQALLAGDTSARWLLDHLDAPPKKPRRAQ